MWPLLPFSLYSPNNTYETDINTLALKVEETHWLGQQIFPGHQLCAKRYAKHWISSDGRKDVVSVLIELTFL